MDIGFAGVNLELPSLRGISMPALGARWIEKNVWRFHAELRAAVASGVRRVDPAASTHRKRPSGLLRVAARALRDRCRLVIG
jgi:hypothetical protein